MTWNTYILFVTATITVWSLDLVALIELDQKEKRTVMNIAYIKPLSERI